MDSTTIKFESAKKALETISVVKQDVFANSIVAFGLLKSVCNEITQDISAYISTVDKRVPVTFEDKGDNEFWLRFGGDILIFSLHTNVFSFEKTNGIYDTSYIKEDNTRGYFAIVEVYNFLNDSIVYQRTNDIGELITRIFINKDNKFMTDGLGAFGVLFNDVSSQIFDKTSIESLLERVIVESVEYELWVPPFEQVKYIPLNAILEKIGNAPRATSKRLGFVLSSDTNSEQIE